MAPDELIVMIRNFLCEDFVFYVSGIRLERNLTTAFKKTLPRVLILLIYRIYYNTA